MISEDSEAAAQIASDPNYDWRTVAGQVNEEQRMEYSASLARTGSSVDGEDVFEQGLLVEVVLPRVESDSEF
ncbi:hypothetical protein FRC02_004876 [Tulasnella sp. 418]|nr:hypothetical protein FRC02_004876 [Tulasnella sp. 418]